MKHYTQEQVTIAVKNAKSIAQVLRQLNLIEAGGNYRTIHRLIKQYNLDISHFKGQGWSKGDKLGEKRPLNDYLTNKHYIISHRLRLRLIKEKIFLHQCSNCLLTKWLDKPIPLELHHKDGNNENNNLTNLKLLCPNCHTLTPTYRRNKSSNGGARTRNPEGDPF